MRELIIVADTVRNAKSGDDVMCPMAYNQHEIHHPCKTGCAWFRSEKRFTGWDDEIQYTKCFCGNKLIGYYPKGSRHGRRDLP